MSNFIQTEAFQLYYHMVSIMYSIAQSCPAVCNSMDYNIAFQTPLSMGFSCKNTEIGCHFLFHGIFPTQEMNLHLLCHAPCIAAAAAAKSPQSCLTLCDPIDGSPPGSPIPGILQARTMEWVAISFSNAWKRNVKVKSLSHVQLLATPWTIANQAPPYMGFSRQEYWSGVPLPSLPLHCRQILYPLKSPKKLSLGKPHSITDRDTVKFNVTLIFSLTSIGWYSNQ